MRAGFVKTEFLCERAVYKTIEPGGHINSHIVITPARPMELGKTCWNIFEAACEHTPLLRLLRHRGMAASVYLQDGLHADGFLMHQRARHAL